MLRKLALTATILVLCATVAFAASEKRWLHVAVVDEADGDGDGGADVRITVPFGLVDTILPILEKGRLDSGKIRLEGLEVESSDLRQMWHAVREADEGEVVTIREEGKIVRVSKDRHDLHVRVRERGDKGKTDVKVSLRVLDALFSGDEDSLNLAAAVHALGEEGSGRLVVVGEDRSTVQVWVDDRDSSE